VNDIDKGAAAVTATMVGPDSQVSIPNEDPLDEAVTDLNVSKKPSAYSTFNFLNFKFLTTYTTRI
jgi:hypothetical protein